MNSIYCINKSKYDLETAIYSSFQIIFTLVNALNRIQARASLRNISIWINLNQWLICLAIVQKSTGRFLKVMGQNVPNTM